MSTNASLAENLAASNVAFEIGFQEAFSNPMPGAFSLYTRVRPASTIVTELDMVSNFPMMREWVGSRREKYLRGYAQRVTLKTYEATLPFQRKQMQYGDQLGLVAEGIKDWLANQTAAFDLSAYTAYMSASGAGPTGYDGAALFSTAHPHSGAAGNQSNLSAGTNLSAAAVDAALVAMGSLTLENNEPMGFHGTHILVGPALVRRARAIFGNGVRVVTVDANGKLDATASVVASAAGYNQFAGELTIVEDLRRVGTPAYYWDILDLSRPNVRPMIKLVGEAPHPIHQDKLTDPKRFSRDQFVYGLEGDWVDDSYFWGCAYRATGTA